MPAREAIGTYLTAMFISHRLATSSLPLVMVAALLTRRDVLDPFDIHRLQNVPIMSSLCVDFAIVEAAAVMLLRSVRSNRIHSIVPDPLCFSTVRSFSIAACAFFWVLVVAKTFAPLC